MWHSPELADMMNDAFSKVTAILTNVPGPAQKVRLCGQVVDDIMFYAFANAGTFLGIISYDDRVSVGVVTGKDLEPDARRLAKHWAPAFRRLQAAVKKAEPSQMKPPVDRSDGFVLGALALLAGFLLWKKRVLR